jgi:hypothetical protein
MQGFRIEFEVQRIGQPQHHGAAGLRVVAAQMLSRGRQGKRARRNLGKNSQLGERAQRAIQ